MSVQFRILGPLEVLLDGRPARLGGPRQRAVLATLLLRAGQVVPAGVVVDEVWADRPPDSAVNLVQGYVSGLRKQLGREMIETLEPGYRVTASAAELDLRRFESLATSGGDALAAGDADAAAHQLKAGLALWRGPALADLVPLGIATAAAARLDELRLTVTERYAEALLRSGDAPAATAVLEGLVSDHPLREGPRGLLMLALYRCGRAADALAAFRAARLALVEELGIEPGSALRELEAAILRQDPALDPPATAGREPPAADAGASTGGARTDLRRIVLAAALTAPAAARLAAVAEPLVRSQHGRELVVATTVDDAAALSAAAIGLHRLRDEAEARGMVTRAAAFTSSDPGADLARLATEQDADLLLVDAPYGLLADPRLVRLLHDAPCDVGVLVGGPVQEGPVVVTFAGAPHDWAGVEIGAWYARETSRALRLAGALAADGGRDSSHLLATASLVVQRAFGVAAEPVLVPRSPEALVAAVAGAGLVVTGLSDRWRQDGLGRTRTALAAAVGHPTLLVRRGLRPGGLRGQDPGTRFTWTVLSPG